MFVYNSYAGQVFFILIAAIFIISKDIHDLFTYLQSFFLKFNCIAVQDR